MLEEFDFRATQLRYLKAAMTQLPTFAPDGKTPADVQAILDASALVRTGFQTAKTARDLGLGELHEATQAGHTAAVSVYPIMKSRYRNDPGSLEAISKLPIADQTMDQTVKRMEMLTELWGQLPNPPDSATPFQAWDTMAKTDFDALLAAIITGNEAQPGLDQTFELKEGDLHTATNRMADFGTAALIQGRGQFLEGTAGREVIDAIPTEAAQTVPDQAVITEITSPGAGMVHFHYLAPHATTFDVMHKGPGDADFAPVAEDVIVREFSASGQAAGVHQYQIVPRNSRGDGPASEIASVTVA